MKISELLNRFPEESVNLQPKEISVDSIKEKTMKKIQTSRKPVMSVKRRVFSAIAVAAALVVVLTGVAFATGIIKYDNTHGFYSSFFGGKSTAALTEAYEPGAPGAMYEGQTKFEFPAQERVPVDEEKADELIGDKITPETGTLTGGGYTLTLEANLYDSETGCGLLYLTLENPNGFPGLVTLKNGIMMFDYEKGAEVEVAYNVGGRDYIDAEKSTDTKLYYCISYINPPVENADMHEKEITVGFATIKTDERGVYISGEGHGVLTIPLGGESLESVKTANGAITVTPIGIRIDGAAIGIEMADYIREVSLIYKDGSTYVLTSAVDFMDNTTYGQHSGRAGSTDNSGYYYSTVSTMTFNRLVDTAQVAAVVVEGAEYPIG
ncbi:MAG: hypothetical protein LBO63_05570 [Oscillospiraceae bacterium]|jgi:hypothetical protein|nr:hypothetical protein [Oscillospiraceae bacterium]